ncbi:hypothetical protein OIU34_24600 [Pararhizobium sp. BT-229]|uniref:hypothetical protein n=1 Tax=Pararhizobium sp. BT-229 TaxID=2986923 RepID=UPI0021F7EF62|nr:hypothetical protein [Pararhizobium sp. BT-229]MCV9965082.1 hypothetical protein [Pararhizobium sp. BT-229]
MRYNAQSLRRDYTFDVTNEELLALMKVEDMSCQLDEHTSLVTYLNKLPGISRIEYDGHFGPHVFASVDTDEDEWEWRVEMLDRAIGWFMDDARRLCRFFPTVVEGDYETETGLDMVYSDEDFVILKADKGTVLVGHAGGIKKLKKADFVLETITADVDERRHLEDENIWLPVNPSRELAEVRKWVASFVTLPEVSELPTVSVESRWLSLHMPQDSRPVWANDDFIVADKNGSLSVTFKTRDSTGTKFYIEAARDQIMSMVRDANANASSGYRLAKYLENQVGSDLARAPKFR